MTALGAAGSRGVGAVSTTLAVAAMAADHLLPGDWPAFLISSGLCLAAAALLFLRVLPRLEHRPDALERAAVVGLVLASLAIVPGIALLWLGFPIVVAGAGLALGLKGRDGRRRRLATAATAVGAVGVLGGFVLELAVG